MEMELFRKSWNKRQKEFRQALLSFSQHQEAIQLGLRQHAQLHSAKVRPSETWSYEDAILDDMTEAELRCVPPKGEHSAAWLIWHLARIEDVALNLLVAGSPQVFDEGDWQAKLKVAVCNTGNAMTREGVASLSSAVDLAALRAYRTAVGRRTQAILQNLQLEELKQKVSPARLEQVMAEGAVVEEASGLIDYWSKRNIAGLLLMPATRHNFVHLNEVLQVKMRCRKLLGGLRG
ncbi:MAG: DinB family protein [Chloroflexi bacterium]|nr:DinB family protein [Chloroflexota bacterium]